MNIPPRNGSPPLQVPALLDFNADAAPNPPADPAPDANARFVEGRNGAVNNGRPAVFPVHLLVPPINLRLPLGRGAGLAGMPATPGGEAGAGVRLRAAVLDEPLQPGAPRARVRRNLMAEFERAAAEEAAQAAAAAELARLAPPTPPASGDCRATWRGRFGGSGPFNDPDGPPMVR